MLLWKLLVKQDTIQLVVHKCVSTAQWENFVLRTVKPNELVSPRVVLENSVQMERHALSVHLVTIAQVLKPHFQHSALLEQSAPLKMVLLSLLLAKLVHTVLVVQLLQLDVNHARLALTAHLSRMIQELHKLLVPLVITLKVPERVILPIVFHALLVRIAPLNPTVLRRTKLLAMLDVTAMLDQVQSLIATPAMLVHTAVLMLKTVRRSLFRAQLE